MENWNEIVNKLTDRRLNIAEVSRLTGISRFTLHKIVNGTQKSMKLENLKKLYGYFYGSI